VEILDVSPLVDFGYTTISPALGLFGTLRPEMLAPFAPYTEASQLSDPSPGRVPQAIPEDQPYNSGAPSVQPFHFERGQNTGFATFVGSESGREAPYRSRRSWASWAMRRCAKACTARSRPA